MGSWKGLAVKLWKALGLAGLAGVAAGGAIIARDQRQRAQLSPEEIKERLRQRVDEAQTNAQTQAQTQAQTTADGPDQSDSTDSSARA
jgi:hypothetical protein